MFSRVRPGHGGLQPQGAGALLPRGDVPGDDSDEDDDYDDDDDDDGHDDDDDDDDDDVPVHRPPHPGHRQHRPWLGVLEVSQDA